MCELSREDIRWTDRTEDAVMHHEPNKQIKNNKCTVKNICK